ncbi:MAG TPA: hypothetical protein PKC60_06355 [Hydrogenophaga sp.]|uniref:hypothetical protein n=1 Tax=Hydrogenophaga sp. TaxID=1904254 RepID=UPI002BED3E2F|nr:hypothetical protein [Hydrogenophaga sp.]HMN92837.1 hypothetical protein [Hydrogenophaga sp.]HMP10322.1 hypothetical protein [Hydrogenophaga sp.]
MTPPQVRSRSLASRLALMSVAMLATVLLITSGVMALVAEGRSRDRIVLWVGDKAQSVADSIDAFDSTARLMTDRAYQPFRRKFADTFEIDPGGTMLTSWGMLLNDDFTEVDMFHEQNGGGGHGVHAQGRRLRAHHHLTQARGRPTRHRHQPGA